MGPDAASRWGCAGGRSLEQPVADGPGGLHRHAAGRLFEQSEAVCAAGGFESDSRARRGGESADAPEAETRREGTDRTVRRAILAIGPMPHREPRRRLPGAPAP